MKDKHPGTSQNSKQIKATPEKLYKAFTDPGALETFLAPGNMTGKVHQFDLSVGGGYRMSLFYPSSEKEHRGKTKAKEDRFTSRFTELTPYKRIVQAINFDSPDPAFAGEMIMEAKFEPIDNGTTVTITFSNIPHGIRSKDNEKGTAQTLEKLAHYVE